MRSRATERFWQALRGLPEPVQRQARASFRMFERNPFHPGLQFKQVDSGRHIWSVRVGIGYRAMGIREESGGITWFWIGSHADYDKLA